MSIDTEKIKKAFDDFESDNFVDADETLRNELRGALKDHLQSKLNLKNEVPLNKEK